MKAQAYRSVSAGWCVPPLAVAITILMGAACHPQPLVITTASAAVGGTIAGVLNGPSGETLRNRTVTLLNLETGQRYQTTTGVNGGYAVRVPVGTYRLDIQLRDSEQLSPDDPTILLKNGDTTPTDTSVNTNRQ